VKIQKISIVFAGISALLTAAAHALVGQTHLTRILATSVEAIDSAVIFAVWQMVTVTLFVSGIGPLLLLLCKENIIVRTWLLTIAITYFFFGIVFIVTSFIYSEPALQWIAMLIVSLLSFVGYIHTEKRVSAEA